MTNLAYEIFLEKIVKLLKSQVKGEVWLHCHTYGVMSYYTIVVKFQNTEIKIYLDCGIGGKVWNIYDECRGSPNKTNELIEQYIRRTIYYLVDCLKGNILDIFFKNQK